MTMRPQMVIVKRFMYYHLASISKIRRYMDQETCARVVMSLVMLRLDYGNALLLGQSQCALRHLKVAHHSAAHIVTRTGGRQYITPLARCVPENRVQGSLPCV